MICSSDQKRKTWMALWAPPSPVASWPWEALKRWHAAANPFSSLLKSFYVPDLYIPPASRHWGARIAPASKCLWLSLAIVVRISACGLQVRLYDEDLIKSDDDLGTAMVSMAALEPGKPQDLSLELKGGRDAAGEGQLWDATGKRKLLEQERLRLVSGKDGRGSR
eukprot:scaffold104058_cov18-Tisochrysis_lutea.AAC.5